MSNSVKRLDKVQPASYYVSMNNINFTKSPNQIKGCFLLQRSFAPIGHAMAYIFQKKYQVAEHCAYVSVRKNYEFLLNQTDVKYTSLLLDEDIHPRYKDETLDLKYLAWLEKEYGIPNLWPYLSVDRILMHGQFLRLYPYDQPLFSQEDLLKILQVTAKKIISFLEKEKPDFIFFAAVGSLGPMLLYEIAKKKGIPTFSGEFSRFKNQYAIIDDLHEFSSISQQFLKIRRREISPVAAEIERAKSILQSFNAKPAGYDDTTASDQPLAKRQKSTKLSLPAKIYWSIRSLIKTLAGYTAGEQSNYLRVNPWFYFTDRLKRKIRLLIGYNDLYDSTEESDNFVYFPLNFEPELSLLFCAPFATDQINVIKQLARALPISYKLYVKEHPHMFGYRTRKFYQEIKKMPNVKLIRPDVPSFELIKKAKLIATISGTSGWEAILLKKPVITFGATSYNTLSMVKYCTSMHNLAALVKKQLENFHFDEQELLDFTIALLKDTAPVNMLHLWRDGNWQNIKTMAQEVEPLVDLIAEKLNLKASKIDR